MSDISVSQDFTTLCKNLRMSDYIVKDVQTRYHAITKRINKDFWFRFRNKPQFLCRFIWTRHCNIYE